MAYNTPYLEGRVFLSPPFLKVDLGGLLGTYLITPDPSLEKGGRKPPILIAILIVQRHTRANQAGGRNEKCLKRTRQKLSFTDG
jgi:hypothetical protein